MSSVECWHPIESLRIGTGKDNDIVSVECGRCHDLWTAIKRDRLVSYIECVGRKGDDGSKLYVEVRNDGRHSSTSRAHTLTGWEALSGVAR